MEDEIARLQDENARLQQALQAEVAARKQAEDDDWVHPIGNDASVACGVFLLLARRHVPGDVHPTQDLAMCALHMVWASVDDAMAKKVARQSFLRLATPGALSLTNVNGSAMASSFGSPFVDVSSICHGPRANVIVRVDTEGLTGVTEIDDDFLRECKSLRAVNLRGLVNVTRIGDCFLQRCESLTAVDLAPLGCVTEIGYCFMDGCRELQAVDLAPLVSVTEIDTSFMAGCAALTAIDLAPLSQVTITLGEFLCGCTSLQSLDCRPLRSATTIEGGFLHSCTSLRQLDVSSFATVTRISDAFLANCPALRTLDLSSMTNVAELNSYELLRGHQLESLVRPETGELATAAIDGF